MYNKSELSEDDKNKIQVLIYHTTDLIRNLASRIGQSEKEQKDNHPNSWWKFWDTEVYSGIKGIVYTYCKLVSGEDIIKNELVNKIINSQIYSDLEEILKRKLS